jgi:hypothetical protein
MASIFDFDAFDLMNGNCPIAPQQEYEFPIYEPLDSIRPATVEAKISDDEITTDDFKYMVDDDDDLSDLPLCDISSYGGTASETSKQKFSIVPQKDTEVKNTHQHKHRIGASLVQTTQKHDIIEEQPVNGYCLMTIPEDKEIVQQTSTGFLQIFKKFNKKRSMIYTKKH